MSELVKVRKLCWLTRSLWEPPSTHRSSTNLSPTLALPPLGGAGTLPPVPGTNTSLASFGGGAGALLEPGSWGGPRKLAGPAGRAPCVTVVGPIRLLARAPPDDRPR